jgi:hypothetical protein
MTYLLERGRRSTGQAEWHAKTNELRGLQTDC